MYNKCFLALAVFMHIVFPHIVIAQHPGFVIDKVQHTVRINTSKINMLIDYHQKLSVVSMAVNGQQLINAADGIYTAVTSNGKTYSSLQLQDAPIVKANAASLSISAINYGEAANRITENWLFTLDKNDVRWTIERSVGQSLQTEEAPIPVFNFDRINDWEGAYQGYGGLAWFYLFNEKLCTYGVHTSLSDFWNSKTGNGLSVSVSAKGKQVAMKYSRTNTDRLEYSIAVNDKEMQPRYDSGTNRRRFIRGNNNVWNTYTIAAGKSAQTITLGYFDYNEKYGRGSLKGLDNEKVAAVLNTIARIGVIDSLHFGGNSWHTPYGPICLHEQYIGQIGLAVNDPKYLQGYQHCLDYYRDHAIKPDGRVFSRWAYTNEDMMPGQVNEEGFYEARWGFLMDANPDFVTNIAELYDQTGNTSWVKTHQLSCEKVLDWILNRDSNNNGLVEMMNNSQRDQTGSDWIDIVWASYENAFVNAKFYHALKKWAAIETQLNNPSKAAVYNNFAARLKTSFNKPIEEGGFWDAANNCYVHWLDKDKMAHGRNMVTPVNFMAIAYGICDNAPRRKLILDTIEAQMQREKLFFWPLVMSSYAPGEAKDEQYPFPAYENGDIFLSWGSVAVKAYCEYDPAIAVKYIKNVLNQYSKDGLAFQRYGRIKQDGMGDDILSGNSLSIVGLYQSVYGINPLYNRFYLNPRITAALAGTIIRYRFRGSELKITLDTNHYTVAGRMFRLSALTDFGYAVKGNQLSYFKGADEKPSLQCSSTTALDIQVEQYDAKRISWTQSAVKQKNASVSYRLLQLRPLTWYVFSVDGHEVKRVQTAADGSSLLDRLEMFSGKMELLLRNP